MGHEEARGSLRQPEGVWGSLRNPEGPKYGRQPGGLRVILIAVQKHEKDTIDDARHGYALEACVEWRRWHCQTSSGKSSVINGCATVYSEREAGDRRQKAVGQMTGRRTHTLTRRAHWSFRLAIAMPNINIT